MEKEFNQVQYKSGLLLSIEDLSALTEILSNCSEAPLDWYQGTLGCRVTHFGKPCYREYHISEEESLVRVSNEF